MNTRALLAISAAFTAAVVATEPKFRAVVIDDKIQIGYGLAVADVDGDGRPDILLADKKQFVWYRNPTWEKFVLAENLTEKDNVCIAARDLDGDGKCEVAVGAEWNPADTEKSGAVFYLITPADRTQKWEAVKFPSVEPTTHRMKWIKLEDGAWGLVVVPLHGRGNKNGEGAPALALCYRKPADPHGEWKSELVCGDMHMTHNFERMVFPDDESHEHLLIGGKEGVSIAMREDGQWKCRRAIQHADYQPPLAGVGEIRIGWRTRDGECEPFGAAVEPMHGNTLALYLKDAANSESKTPPRTVLDSTLEDGHALACGDLLGLGRDQVVVGWRAMQTKGAKVGIKLFVPDESYQHWTQHVIDDNEMACEDLVLADLNGDGKLDIIAAGRATKNVKIYFNETVR